MREKQPKLPPIKDCFSNGAFVACALKAAWGAWRNDFNLPLGRLVVACLPDSRQVGCVRDSTDTRGHKIDDGRPAG